MKELQIAAAQKLGKLEGMGKSPYIIAQVIGNDRRIAIFHRSRLTGDYYRESGKQLVKEHYGNLNNSFPYLKIDDSSEWSSAKILARAGWKPNKEVLTFWMKSLLPCGRWIARLCEDLKSIEDALLEGNHELAYILAIILLQKIDNEAYLKAMEPLK